MFIDQKGALRTSAEKLFARIECCPDREAARLAEKREVLSDALADLDTRLAALPEIQRDAVLSVLYGSITDTVFDLHVSIEASKARTTITVARSREEKMQALLAFRGVMDRLTCLYKIGA